MDSCLFNVFDKDRNSTIDSRNEYTDGQTQEVIFALHTDPSVLKTISPLTGSVNIKSF